MIWIYDMDGSTRHDGNKGLLGSPYSWKSRHPERGLPTHRTEAEAEIENET